MKKSFLTIFCVLILMCGAHSTMATAGKCCATIIGTNTTGGNIASACCTEPDTASGNICAAGQTEVDCGSINTCPTSSTAGTICAASAPSSATSTAPTAAEYPIIVPKLSIDIPTISMPDFAKVTQSGDYLYIPFISVYLVGAYKMGVGIAAILAVIMIMVGGIIWIAAAGDAGRIGQAKTMISGAVVGLVLTVGSYVALQTVNPDLVNFTALKIPIIGTKTVDIYDNYNPELGGPTGGGTGALSPSQLDPIFQKYAPCAGITPAALKAIASVESSLNPNATNGSYVGLFQTTVDNCPAKVRSYCNAGLSDPDNNTAAGAAEIGNDVNTINNNCSNPSAHDQLVMLYIGHNIGPSFLSMITRGGSCDVSTMRQAAINYYATSSRGITTAANYAPKHQPICVNNNTDTQTYANCTGGPKFDYAMSLADKTIGNGVSQVITSSPGGTCPY